MGTSSFWNKMFKYVHDSIIIMFIYQPNDNNYNICIPTYIVTREIAA